MANLADEIKTLPGYDPYRDSDGYHFDEVAAQLAIDFFGECVVHTKGDMAGKPYILEPHERALTANIFGWKDAAGKRRYREVFYFVARKNSKTTWAAGLALLILFQDREPGAECYCAAADRDQASLLFGQAMAMVNKCPHLSSRAKIYLTGKSIVYEEEGSSFKAISAEAASKHGYNSHLIIIDELHAQRDSELVDVLTTSTGSRSQPLTVYISTSDYERPGSICNDTHKQASHVRDGINPDATFLPAIYELTDKDDWKDETAWLKANPNLGKSLKMEYMRGKFKKAIERPSYENTFKRLHLNIRTEQAVRWLKMDAFDLCKTNFSPESLRGRVCYAGLDLSSTTDLSSLSLVFPEDSESCYTLNYNWLPGDGIKKKGILDHVPYEEWAKTECLELTPGNVIDYEYIRRKLNELNTMFDIQGVAIDRWNATHLITLLTGDGFNVVPFGQGFASMNAPSKEMEKLVVSHSLLHNGNPVFRWAASNVTVEMDAAGNIKPSKNKSSHRIDPIVSVIMALGLSIERAEPVPVGVTYI